MNGAVTEEEQAMIDAAWEKHKAAGPCDRPPEGWRCTRDYGHDGPCAAFATPPAPEPSKGHRPNCPLSHIDLQYSSCGCFLPSKGEAQPVAWPLKARVWKREDEWVLEIEGSLDDTMIISRHTQPSSVALKDVPGLPTLYATPPSPDVSALVDALREIHHEAGHGSMQSSGAIKRIRKMSADILSKYEGDA